MLQVRFACKSTKNDQSTVRATCQRTLWRGVADRPKKMWRLCSPIPHISHPDVLQSAPHEYMRM